MSHTSFHDYYLFNLIWKNMGKCSDQDGLDFEIIYKSLAAEAYISKVLEELIYDDLFLAEYAFQQRYSRTHTAKKTMKWFQEQQLKSYNCLSRALSSYIQNKFTGLQRQNQQQNLQQNT
ncbi:hypothetical protein ABPG74_013633 [Tetrahymena malaccensis]